MTNQEMYEAMARSFFGIGEPNQKIATTGFTQALFALAAVCDGHNLAKLREAFPEAIDAFTTIRES